MDVAHWLRDLGLERYEAAFRANDVNAQLLPNLTADDLKDLGITSAAIAANCLKRSRRWASKTRRLLTPTNRPAQRGLPARSKPPPNAAHSA